ncbi:MAG TPA: hypothetical protein VMF06_17145 [Candidatus Limnocylindria bacterium]|jgi:hypothetical protein|nr:hypothetical protein [Candidatus Limnocylindria bacterium]
MNSTPAFHAKSLSATVVQTAIPIAVLASLKLLGAEATATAAAATPTSDWSTSASLTVKETYDSNVYMQSVSPLANQGSLVTFFAPSVGVQWKPSTMFNIALNYSPEVSFYHSESSEDFVTHKASANLNGKIGDATWEFLNSLAWIDGNDESPTFFGPGGAPAVGGVPLRDRRDAAIWRNSFKFQQPLGDNWFVRPVATFYLHDFMTAQKANPPGATYANYVDRSDINGGLDFGRRITGDTWCFIGYRYGSQHQATALNTTIAYSNDYQRILAGLEGKPFSWLKLNLSAGPDFREFGHDVPVGFERHKTLLFIDASATVTPTKTDSITLSAKRFEQPGYGGASVFEDATYELAWRHKFGAKMTIGAGARLLNWDVEDPVKRNEWWYNGNAMAAYAFDKHWTAEIGYSYDSVESLVANTAGREAERHLGYGSVKYTF